MKRLGLIFSICMLIWLLMTAIVFGVAELVLWIAVMLR